MKRFYILTGEGYKEMTGYKITIPGYENLLLFAHVSKAGSRKYWHLTEGWTGYSVSNGNFHTRKQLVENSITTFRHFESRGHSFDKSIRQSLEAGFMAPMPI